MQYDFSLPYCISLLFKPATYFIFCRFLSTDALYFFNQSLFLEKYKDKIAMKRKIFSNNN